MHYEVIWEGFGSEGQGNENTTHCSINLCSNFMEGHGLEQKTLSVSLNYVNPNPRQEQLPRECGSQVMNDSSYNG